jgi:hypothetical protein
MFSCHTVIRVSIRASVTLRRARLRNHIGQVDPAPANRSLPFLSRARPTNRRRARCRPQGAEQVAQAFKNPLRKTAAGRGGPDMSPPRCRGARIKWNDDDLEHAAAALAAAKDTPGLRRRRGIYAASLFHASTSRRCMFLGLADGGPYTPPA